MSGSGGEGQQEVEASKLGDCIFQADGCKTNLAKLCLPWSSNCVDIYYEHHPAHFTLHPGGRIWSDLGPSWIPGTWFKFC